MNEAANQLVFNLGPMGLSATGWVASIMAIPVTVLVLAFVLWMIRRH